MLDPKQLDDLARRLAESMPEGLKVLREDLSRGFRSTLESGLGKLDLVTREEFDAVDWYDQRAAVTQDPELKAILLHNRNEEMEHAAMVLEWLRRHYPVLDEELRTYLFREGDIVASEQAATGKDGEGGEEAPSAPAADGSLGIGSLRGR